MKPPLLNFTVLPPHRLARFAIAALTATLLLGGCQKHEGEAPKAAPEPEAPALRNGVIVFDASDPQLPLLKPAVAKPARSVDVDLPARLVWNEERTQRIVPAFAGRVTSIDADVGRNVRPGTVLARLASPDFAVAQADAAKARTDAALAARSLARQRELHGAGIVARKDLEMAEADAARSQAELARATARTRLYGSAGGRVDQQLTLVSSIAGTVVERNLNPGQELRPDQFGAGGAPVLFTITDPTDLWVQIDAREFEAGTLRPGAAFQLRVAALPGQVFDGRVVAASDAIDPTTRTIKVRGRVANPERRLKGEMLGSARFERVIGGGVVVPAGAVMQRGSRHLVFVQVKPNAFEAREVSPSHEGTQEVALGRGLEVGETVVAENALLLSRLYFLLQGQQPPAAAASASPSAASRP